MNRRSVAAVAALCFLTAQASPPPDSIPLDLPKAQLYVNEGDEAAMIDDLNRLRVAAGVKTLTVDLRLVKLARDYARTMLEGGFFGHRDAKGHTPADRMKAAKLGFRKMGENIAFGPNEATAQAGLTKSPEHHRNMLDPAFSRVGVGVIADSVYGSVFVQEFAGD